jgi:Xaa-Pro dipeptidase
MNKTSSERVMALCMMEQLSALLLSNPNSLTWLTGYAPPIETGQSPFEGGPALAWYLGGELTLLVSDMEAGAARLQAEDVSDYVSYTIEAPLAGFSNQAAALAGILGKVKNLTGKVGVEFDYLPASLLAVVKEKLPLVDLVPLSAKFEALRAIKSLEEIERLRSTLRLCDFAQAETKRLAKPGKTELDVWVGVKARLELEAGTRVPVLADLVAGKRTAEIGGLPAANIIKEGDPVLSDIVPRLNGYWGDNCDTHFAGKPSAEMSKIHAAVLETLRLAIRSIKPGLKACDLDALMRSSIREQGYPVYPHHSGHGIGTSYHEQPRIVPYNTLQLEAGMVIALEPGVYIPDVGGVRLEDVVLVTETGCELLTRHLEKT